MKKTIISMLALSALVMGGCKGNKDAKVDEGTKKALVNIVPATVQNVEKLAEFTSNIEPFQQNSIAPSMGIRIDRILVDVGARVSKGQLLATMDRAQYNQAKTQLNVIKTDYDRLQSVYDAGGVSKQQLDQAKAAYDVQKEVVDNLFENIELRSPITGVVTARDYDPGDMYSSSKPIMQIMQINPLKVTIDISEQYFADVRNGMPVDIAVDLFPDKSFTGKVSLIYPTIDPATRTFKVEVSIPNGANTLRPGMFSRSTIKFGERNSVVVDDIAVQKQIGSNEKYVFVVIDGKAERRTVNVGRLMGKKVEILSGINDGEQVVVSGISRLAQGTEVEVAKK